MPKPIIVAQILKSLIRGQCCICAPTSKYPKLKFLYDAANQPTPTAPLMGRS